jgi:hypothetical protein
MSMVRWFPLLAFAGFRFAASCLAADAIGREKAIVIATEYLRSPHLDMASFEVSAERRTAPPADAVIPAERFAHHPFWLVSFTPRKPQRGGAYAVYVAVDTGEILGSRGYR